MDVLRTRKGLISVTEVQRAVGLLSLVYSESNRSKSVCGSQQQKDRTSHIRTTPTRTTKVCDFFPRCINTGVTPLYVYLF